MSSTEAGRSREFNKPVEVRTTNSTTNGFIAQSATTALEYPRGWGRWRTLGEVVLDLGQRGGRHLPRGRLRGRSAAGFGDVSRFDDDRAWHDALLFHEYFRGDSGVGLGASHQTGWSGLVADLVVRLSRARESRASS